MIGYIAACGGGECKAKCAVCTAAMLYVHVSQFDLIDRNSPFAPFYEYYLSLLHSKNPNDVSVFDAVLYNETNEDWLIKEGFGALIMRYGGDIPVSLNCPVTAVGDPDTAIAGLN